MTALGSASLSLRVLVAALAVLVAASLSWAQSDPPPSLWDALAQARDPKNPAQARRSLVLQAEEALSIVDALFSGVTFDEESDALRVRVAEHLSELDIAALHEMLPFAPFADGRKELYLDVRRLNRRYHATGVDPRHLQRVPDGFAPRPGLPGAELELLRRSRNMGDAWTWLQVTPPPHQAGNYRVASEGGARLGDTGADGLFNGLEGLARYFEVLARDRRSPSDAAREALARAFPACELQDLVLLEGIREAMPQTLAMMAEYVDLRELGRYDSREEAFLVRIKLALRPERFGAEYPALGGYLRRIAGLFTVQSELQDDQGRLLARLFYESEHHRIGLSAVFRQGRLMPCRGRWRPIPGHEGYGLTDRAERRFRVVSTVKLAVKGIVIRIENLAADLVTQWDDDGFHATMTFQDVPDLSRVEGAFLGFVPLWLVDLVIPGNLDEITRDFLRAMTRGRDGRGAQARAAIVRNGEGSVDLRASLATELLNNGVLRFAMDLAGRVLMPDADEWADLARFVQRLVFQARADLHRQEGIWRERPR